MPLLNESANGVFVITVTPFTDDGALDLASTDRAVDFYLERGATGLTVLGVMGEAPKLTAEEARSYVKRVLARVNDRIPVIVGVSAPGFAAMRELAESVMEMGAAGVMVAPASTVKTDDQAYNYFEMVAETIGPKVPFCMQDHPLATGVQLPTPVMLRIFKAIPTCVMLKHEDWPGPGLPKLSAIRAASDRGETTARVDPRRQRRRTVSARRTIPRRGRRDDRLRLSRDDGRRVEGARDRKRRARARHLRCVSPARALRAAVGARTCSAQVHAREARRDRFGGNPEAGPKLSAADIADIDRLIARQTKRLKEIG